MHKRYFDKLTGLLKRVHPKLGAGRYPIYWTHSRRVSLSKIMGRSNRIAPDIRAQILKRVQEEGIPVAQAAKEHGIHESTIYNWLSDTVAANAPTLREMNALRKENAMLKTLVGEMTVTLSRSQKKR